MNKSLGTTCEILVALAALTFVAGVWVFYVVPTFARGAAALTNLGGLTW